MIHLLFSMNFIPFTLFPPPSLFLIFTDGTSAVWHAGPRGNSTDLGDFMIQFPALRQPFVVSQASTRRNPESISVYHDDSTVVTLSTLTNKQEKRYRLNQLGSQLGSNGVAITSSCVPCSPTPEDADRGWSRKPFPVMKKSPFFWGWSVSFWESIMDAMKIENFLYGKYDEVLSIVDVVMFTTVMAVWCAFAICRVTSYRKHRTNSSRQPAVLGKKVQQIRGSKALSKGFPVFATSPLAVLQAWHAPSEYWDPAIKNPLPSSKKYRKIQNLKTWHPKMSKNVLWDLSIKLGWTALH